jgi:hypothetical protein
MPGSAIFTIEVSVSNGGSSLPTIVCSPDPALVRAANTQLTFKLVTPGWAFAASQPIAMVTSSSQFPSAPTTVNSHCVTLMDLVTVAGTHKYIVNLVNETSGAPLSVDPIVINQPF